jgi:putative transposase
MGPGSGSTRRCANACGPRSAATRSRAGIIDSQSGKATSVGGERGFDGATKLTGRKRHPLVDAPGLALKAEVRPADLQDRAAVALVLDGLRDLFPRLAHLRADQGDNGTGKARIEGHLGRTGEIVRHPPQPRGVWAPIDAAIDGDATIPEGFRGALPRRWVGERTFGWRSHSRRPSQDHERLGATSEALSYATMIRSMGAPFGQALSLFRRLLAHSAVLSPVSCPRRRCSLHAGPRHAEGAADRAEPSGPLAFIRRLWPLHVPVISRG